MQQAGALQRRVHLKLARCRKGEHAAGPVVGYASRTWARGWLVKIQPKPAWREPEKTSVYARHAQSRLRRSTDRIVGQHGDHSDRIAQRCQRHRNVRFRASKMHRQRARLRESCADRRRQSQQHFPKADDGIGHDRILGKLCTGGARRVRPEMSGYKARPTRHGNSMQGGSNAVAGHFRSNPLGPDGFSPWLRHSSLMYLDTHLSSFLASEKIRRGRATCAELPYRASQPPSTARICPLT